MVSSVTSSASSASTGSANALGSSTSGQTQAENFLKLLVAQLKNQDPMSPMDNAQMTSQIAQINTVTGIQQLNTTVTSLASQFGGLQVMQGSSIIGHTVAATGNTLNMGNAAGSGGLNLAGDADKVTIEVSTPGGQLLDSFSLGAMAAGNHSFSWPGAATYSGSAAPVFNVKASLAGQTVSATPLILDTVSSVGSSNGSLNLSLQNGGSIAYSAVQQIF